MNYCVCPVCNESTRQISVLRVTAKQSAEHFFQFAGARNIELLERHIQKLWKSDECVVIRCESCLSRFSLPHVAGDARFYELASSNPGWPEFRWEFEMTKKMAKLALEKGGQLLEIGSGSGAFIKEMLNEGIPVETIEATEFSSVACAELEKLGVRVRKIDFRDYEPNLPFRVIVLFQTLEHLDRLNQVVNALTKLSTDDAEIFISVPNVDYIEWQEKNLKLLDMPPNHLTAFSSLGLRQLFNRSAFIVLDLVAENPISVRTRVRRIVMHKITNPSNFFEKFLSRRAKLQEVKRRKLRLMICSLFIILIDLSWLRRVPPENLWVHLKRIAKSD